MIRKPWFALASAALLGAATASCAAPSAREAVEGRFDAYMNAWIERDIDGIWDSMSPKLKQGNGNSKDVYRKFVTEQNLYFLRYTRLSTKVEGSRAEVIADMTITDSARTETVEERQRCDLVLHRGSWYIDDCKPLQPTA